MSSQSPPSAAPSAVRLPAHRTAEREQSVAAFGAIYLIWGSTYLAIRYGVATIPPYLMTGVRCLIAGGLLYGWSRWRGSSRPAGRAWLAAIGVGSLLFVVGQGVLSWAETRVPSGPAALLVATIPLWMVLVDWARRGGRAPAARVWLGIAVGLSGVLLLTVPGGGAAGVDPLGAVAILLAAISWSVGSFWARSPSLPESRTQSAGMQLLAAGAVLVVIAAAIGEPSGFDPREVSGRSLAALAYLILFGSVVAFSAYIWLLDHSTPARIGSHAYVNPIIAVLLGVAAGDGAFSGWIVLATAAVVGAVMLTMEEI